MHIKIYIHIYLNIYTYISNYGKLFHVAKIKEEHCADTLIYCIFLVVFSQCSDCDLSGIFAELCQTRQWQIKSANTSADADTKWQIQVLRYKLSRRGMQQQNNSLKKEAKKCKCESQPMPNDPQLETGQSAERKQVGRAGQGGGEEKGEE